MILAPLSLLLLSQTLSVPVPLERYEELTRKKEPRSLTVVESARLEGSLARGLTLTLSGRSMGDLPAVPVIDGDVVLKGCSTGQALLSRGDKARIDVTPLAERFTVRCGVPIPADHKVSLAIRGVVDVSGSVSDGTLKIDDVKDGVVTVEAFHPEPVEHTTAPLEEPPLPPTVVGRYRVTVLPDEARFRWELDAHNPNRKPVSFPLPVRANETLEKLETPAHYEPTADGFTVELPPGDTKLAVTGAMKGTRFEPPIDAAAQFVLLDSHPLLRLEVTTEGKRLCPTETGLEAEYRGAQGLLLARGQSIQWKATVLETLTSTSYSVRSVGSRFFVGPDGKIFGESVIGLDNEGAAELTLPMKHQPEYAAIGGTSVPLTSTPAGDLRLPLARGAQEISVRHQGTLRTGFGFAAGTLELPGVGATATHSSVELLSGRDWVPLYQSFAGQRWFALPRLGALVLALLFALWAVHLFTKLGLARRPAVALGAVTAVLASSTDAAHWPVVIGLAGGTTLYVMAWLKESKVKLVAPSGLVGYSMAMACCMLLLVGGVTLFGDNIRRLFGMSADALAGDDNISASYSPGSFNTKSMKNFGGASSYVGTGVARQLPSARHAVSLSEELVDTSAPTSATVVLVSSSVTYVLYALLNLLAVAMAFVMRRQLLAGLKAQAERLFAARPVETEPPVAA